MTGDTNRQLRRGAFTLTEILVVIAIIAVLAALTSYGVTAVVKGQRVNNTQSAMRTIQKVLNEHWAYVIAEAKKETGLEAAYSNIDQLYGPDSTGGDRDRIIWIKWRLMEAFPRNYADVRSCYAYANIPTPLRKNNATYVNILNNNYKALPTNNPGSESAACLAMALSITRNGTSLNVDSLGSTNVADTDGDGMAEFIDAWGNPLTFFRFPTDNAELQAKQPSHPGGGKTVYADPIDPTGVLFQLDARGRKAFEANVHRLTFQNTPQPAYIVPTLVSSGPDGLLGLTVSPNSNAGASNMAVIPSKAGKTPDAADNIFSFNLN